MTAQRITKRTVDALQSDGSEFTAWDDKVSGFGVRVRAGGKRVWLVQFRIGTKQRRITLGSVDVLDPEEAKKRAKTSCNTVKTGGGQ